MVTVTETAKEYLLGLAEDNEHPEGTVLRLEWSGQEVVLTFGPPDPSDEVIQKDERTVLHISSELAGPLDGAIVDAEDGDGGTRLTLSQ